MAATAISLMPATAAENSNSGTKEKKVDYMPEIHGVVRARWEIDTQNGDQRFQIRNARVNVRQ